MAHKTRPRLVYPSLWDSEKFCGISDRAFRGWAFLLTQADDDGVGQFYTRTFATRPFVNSPLTDDQAKDVCRELLGAGLVEFYVVGGRNFFKLHDWNDFQAVRKDRYQPSTYPQPSDNQVTTKRQPSGALKVKGKGKVKDKGNGSALGDAEGKRQYAKAMERERAQKRREQKAETRPPGMPEAAKKAVGALLGKLSGQDAEEPDD